MNSLPRYLHAWKSCPVCAEKLTVQSEEDAQHLHCRSCGFRHYANPMPTVSALLIKEGEWILLGKRAREPKALQWAIPGGFLDWNESPLDCCERELWEETSMRGHSWSLLGAWEGNYNPDLDMRTVNMHYIGKAETGDPLAGSDLLEVRWFHWSEVPELPFENQKRAWESACLHMGWS